MTGTTRASQTVTNYDHVYLNGRWLQLNDADPMKVQDSFSEEVIANVSLATTSDVEAAVNAASVSLPGWSATPIMERIEFVRRIADELSKQQEELARSITQEVGMPLTLSARIQVDAPIEAWRQYARAAQHFEFTSQIGHSTILQVPVGVVACLTPWNYPLHQITAKVAPALLAGCTCILKPSEQAPAAAYALARAVERAGVPSGVFNLLIGDGPDVGAALVNHSKVQMVSFTGSTAVGQLVAQQAAGHMKRLALELGGKSAAIVLPGTDLQRAVRSIVASCMLNSGQTCNALTRLLVPESELSQVRQLLIEIVAGYTMGDPLDKSTRLGPLVSAVHAQRVRSTIEHAIAAGAELVAGGLDTPTPEQGFFVPATVLLTEYDSRIAQEEVFGPVLCVIPYTDVEEAIAIANGTPYGLAGAVWSSEDRAALEVARRLRCGQVDINGARFNISAPFGGFGMSGLGRENGLFGLAEFVEPISIQMSPS